MADHIAIITVVYENYTVLEAFLESLAKQTSMSFHLYIADASSNRQKIVCSLPHTVIATDNLGYAHGVNICVKEAIKQHQMQFCIINDDTILKEDFVCNLQESFKKYPHSLIGGKILYAPGHEFHASRYVQSEIGKVIWYAGGNIDWNHVLTPHRGVDEVDQGQYDMAEKTSFITGCLMGFDLYLWRKIGLWDESYFLYYEDADYSIRASQAGCELYYDPTLVIWHKNAQSTNGSGSTLHMNFQKKSQLRFALKYAPLRTKIHILKNFFL